MKTNKDIETKRLGNSVKGPEPTYTPTPWETAYRVEDNQEIAWKILGVIKDYGQIHKEDAAFIVRAVNSHEALLEAAKEALEVIEENRHQRADENDCASFASPCENRLKAAIAQAEGVK